MIKKELIKELESLIDRVKKAKDYRICENCGKDQLESGYVIGYNDMYFCSPECLHVYYPQDEYHTLYEEGEAYWTKFDD